VPVPLDPPVDPGAEGPPQARGEPVWSGAAAVVGRTLTRRGLLAGAVSVGASLAATRVLVLEKPGLMAAFTKHGRSHNGPAGASVSRSRPRPRVGPLPAPAVDAGPPLSQPLQVSQLLRRLAFGGTDALYQQAMRQGYEKTVDQLLAQPAAQPPPFPGGEALRAGVTIDPGQLQEWWITHMLTTPTPLQERLTLFLAGLFPTDHRKVGTDTPFLAWQNRTWRDMALTDLRSVLTRVSTDPAMLLYLDANLNDGHGVPNQNYARELMEHFSIGLVFSEQDVREGALALSGWRVPQAGKDGTRIGVFESARHFPLSVSFLGRTGPMDLSGVVDAILAHPACAPFVATRLVQEFVTPTPAPAYVDRLAANFRKSGYQLKTLLRDILMSPEFAAQASYRALVKSPLDFMVGAARLAGADPAKAAPLIRQYAVDLGHAPFAAPDAGGYPRDTAWITPLAVAQRVNFVTDLVGTLGTVPATATLVQRYLDGILSPGTGQALGTATREPQRLWTLLASPDAQVA
jgi:uncharacterized protein (DUF1800 family)